MMTISSLFCRVRNATRRAKQHRSFAKRQKSTLASVAEIQGLEERLLLSVDRLLAPVIKDFSATDVSQFGLGSAVIQGHAFLGIEGFDTGTFTIDAFDDFANAGGSRGRI